MFPKELLHIFCLYFIIYQVNVSGCLEDIWKDIKRLSKGNTGEYQQGGDEASISGITNSPNNFDTFLLDENTLDLLTIPSAVNETPGTNNAAQPSNFDPHLSPEHDQSAIDFADSLLQYPEETGRQEANVPDPPDQSALGLAPGVHTFIKLDGKSHDIRGSCQKHCEYFNVSKRVKTKCDACDEFLCAKCHQRKHGLAQPPPEPMILVPEYQTCIFCNKNVKNKEIALKKHIYFKCANMPRDRRLNIPNICCICGKQFNKGYNFETHLRTHTKERPFVCDICQQAFVDASNLNKHTDRLHDAQLRY